MKIVNSYNEEHLEENGQVGICICSVEYGKITYKGKTYWNSQEMMEGKIK